MSFKICLLLGLLMAIVLIISSEVAARDLAETSFDHSQNADETAETNRFEDARGVFGEDSGRGGYGGDPGRRGRDGDPGRCGYRGRGGNGGHGGGYRRHNC